jgi:hypothetical protein
VCEDTVQTMLRKPTPQRDERAAGGEKS